MRDIEAGRVAREGLFSLRTAWRTEGQPGHADTGHTWEPGVPGWGREGPDAESGYMGH